MFVVNSGHHLLTAGISNAHQDHEASDFETHLDYGIELKLSDEQEEVQVETTEGIVVIISFLLAFLYL